MHLPHLTAPDLALTGLIQAETSQAAVAAFADVVAEAGLSDYSYLAGFAEENPTATEGFVVSSVSHVSSCPSDWLEELFAKHGPEKDYDFVRVVTGWHAPFVSGHHILGLMEPLEPHYREILALKAEAGFGANLVIPLPSAPYAKYCYAAMMLISNLDQAGFEAVMSRHYHRLLTATFLLHSRLGGDAHTFLERERAVKSHMRALEPAAEAPSPVPGLTPRQAEVVRLLSTGLRPDAIAAAMALSRVTIDRHLRAAREAMGVKTTAELVAEVAKRQQ